MLVTCPECNTKISSELREECKKCGLPNAARRSLELCEDFMEHGLKKFPLALTKDFSVGPFPLDEHVDSEQGSKRSNFNQYFRLAELHIGEYAHGSGYQINIVLECRTCKKRFTSHVYPEHNPRYGGYICVKCAKPII